MIIGMDLSMLVYAGSGVASYTYNLAKSLLEYDKENSYRFFYASFRRPLNFYYLTSLRRRHACIKEMPLPTSAIRFMWNKHHILPVEYLLGNVDVFHSSDYLRPPLRKKTKGITTIHDLTWKLFPQYHTPDVIKHHERKLKKTVKYGDTIIVDSENTRRDLLRLYPSINPRKTHVIYLGIDEKYKPENNKEKIHEVLVKYKIPTGSPVAPYLLYVGAIEPRKNLDTAIKTFAELIKDVEYQNYLFVIAGRAGWKNEHIFKLVKDLGLEKKVLFTGFVKDEDLPALYSGASALIYLSLYEGFGLPPLEAARCGTPSLIYKNSSLAETFPQSYPFCHEGKELLALKNLLDSRSRINLKFAARFSWEKYVESFLEVTQTLV